ncbi:peptidoglycan DD-metalloendopeptidase family protein [Gynuella sunshinyii]|uniref:Membrane-bound metallopeptidase n=1 Tax=Gynuella sunshinyii YC6258 TaxID=1445510 RepID=A0A0C5VJV1_9GAMM|nr:peptidoglycan DD-metalloendopeptidase family protein [Gynuella sunshinyii]AJQ94561.1 membrane-bound metallopeptidase [Gynuella sunshinyii YC6258]
MHFLRTGSQKKIGRTSKRCAFLSLSLIVTGCINNAAYTYYETSPRVYTTKPVTESTKKTNKDSYTVKPNDTLYSIALAHDLDYRKLAGANNIDSSYAIYPGQKLSLKITSSTPGVYPPKVSVVTEKPSTVSGTVPVNKPKSQKNGTSSSAAPEPKTQKIRWVWPVNGNIVRTYKAGSSTAKGIDIKGEFGEPVNAAADGKVVVVGLGIRGYGNLVIVEHNEQFLTAYAHTGRILVAEQDTVKAGQTIAEIGSSGGEKQSILHFEIRMEGKPLDPLKYLPAR